MATRRWLLGGMVLVGLVALAVPAPARRPAAPPAAAAVYPRYAQASGPLDHWQRRTVPVLVADQPWEHGAVYEPTVLYDAARHVYRMWYTGGWERPAIGTAVSRDGVSWRKGRGPVVGLGAGGFGAPANNSSVTRVAGVYYMTFSGGFSDLALHLATSRDGVHWQTMARPIMRPGRRDVHLANTALWVEGTGAGRRWHLLYESLTPAGIWAMGLAQSVGVDPTHMRRVAFPLPSLQVGAGAYGGPTLSGRAGHYDLYYHAARSGNLPTDVYHATSADRVHWQRAAAGPVLTRVLSWEVDQTADPFVVQGARSRRLLYYAGMDNPHAAGRIGLALWPATSGRALRVLRGPQVARAGGAVRHIGGPDAGRLHARP